jgi:hypothetical protein
VTYSDVRGGYAGEGNLNADPEFADPTDGEFSLRKGSPCIDTGHDAGSLGLGSVTTDSDGKPRGYDGDGLGRGTTGDGSDYDMGAYEYSGEGVRKGED